MNMYFQPAAKEPLEDLVAKEVVNGATFRYCTLPKVTWSKKVYVYCSLGFQDKTWKGSTWFCKILPPLVVLDSERVFDNSNDFVTKKRPCLSDKTIDNLCFLKGIFKEN